MPCLPVRLTTRCVLAAVFAATISGCAAPAPPPAPAPVPPPARKSKPKVTPTPAPTPVAVAPAPAPVVPVAPIDQFKVTVPRTPFYKYGPQQPGGPSQSLDFGTIFTLLKRGFGYSQVRLKDQQTGYVATEEIAALTSQELMAQEQPEAPADLGPLPRPGGIRRSVLPPSTQEELPEPEPKTEATPKFRY